MTEKGFSGKQLAKQCSVWLALLALMAGVCGPLSAAEIRGVRISSTDTGTRVVLDLSGPVTHKAFALEDPARIVVDVARSSIGNLTLPEAQGAVARMRSGPLSKHGVRLVFELAGPVTFETSTAAPSGDAGHRLVLDL